MLAAGCDHRHTIPPFPLSANPSRSGSLAVLVLGLLKFFVEGANAVENRPRFPRSVPWGHTS